MTLVAILITVTIGQLCHNVLCNFDLTVANSKPSKRKLLDHVVPHVSTHWYDLGIKLLNEEYESHLDIIESSHGNDKKECCKKMFWYWLNTNTSATWGQLVGSLTITSCWITCCCC